MINLGGYYSWKIFNLKIEIFGGLIRGIISPNMVKKIKDINQIYIEYF